MVEPTRIAPPAAVPMLLGLIAGYVDACTFLSLFGFFIAQVTGSFAVVGLHVIFGNAKDYAALFAVPVFFAAGMLAAFVAGFNERRKGALPAVLMLETLFLAAFMGVEWIYAPYRDVNAAPAVAAAMLGLSAMGVQSAVVRLAMVGIQSTNVMTTNTTQLAIDLAHVLMSARRRHRDAGAAALFFAARGRLASTGPVVLSFLFGTGLGAVAYREAGTAALLGPLAVLLGLIVWAVAASRTT